MLLRGINKGKKTYRRVDCKQVTLRLVKQEIARPQFTGRQVLVTVQSPSIRPSRPDKQGRPLLPVFLKIQTIDYVELN